jgi:hypothetical protein
MKRKSRIWVQIILIFVLGLVVSFLNGTFDLGFLRGGSDTLDIEKLLHILNISLALFALVLGSAYLFYRAVREMNDNNTTTGVSKED